MQKTKNYTQTFLGIICAIIVIVGIFALAGGFTKEVTIEKEVPVIDVQAIETAVNNAVAMKDIKILELQIQLETQANETIIEEELIDSLFSVDEIFLNDATDEEIYSDRELNLFDGKVDFDGETYDAEETLTLDGIIVLANGQDYDGETFMNVFEESIEYNLEFESELNVSNINEDETLEFNFLGNELEVSNWNGNEITFLHGEDYIMLEGETLEILGSVIVLEFANENSAHFRVDGILKEVDEDSIKTIGDLQIKLDYSFETNNYRTGQVSILVAEDIEKTVTNSDLYEDDSPWEWSIGNGYIGLILAEDYDEVDSDGDEEFQAIGVDESICLPNEYVCLIFNGLSIEDTAEYSISLDTRDSTDYVRVDGDFINGLNDLDRVYVRIFDYKFFDRDLEEITGDLELGNTDSILTADSSGLTFEDFEVNYALNSSNVGSDDEDYLTDYGILVNNPDNSIEDEDWTITVPEEQLESSFSILM